MADNYRSPASSFPAGFNNVTIRGVPVTQAHPGQVFWVGNATSSVLPGHVGASDGNKGTFNAPFSTIDYAIGQCTAGRGDIIFVKPGHAETITTAANLVMDVAGVAIIGLGSGSSRPTLTFSTNATANIPITAANMAIKNFLFVANKADVASVFTATGTATPTDFTIDSCEFRDSTSILNFLSIVTGNATNNSMDGLTFVGNQVFGLGTTAATTPIKLTGTSSRVNISNNYINLAILNNTSAVLAIATGKATTNLLISKNQIFRPNTDTATGGLIITADTASTGLLSDNYVSHADVAAALIAPTGLGLGYMNNLADGDADASGFVLPAIGVN